MNNKNKRKKKLLIKELLLIVFCLVAKLFIISCSDSPKSETPSQTETSSHKIVPTPTRKVLFVNSYHRGYDWSDGITQGILDTFGARLKSSGEVDNSASKVLLKIVFMDTKRNKSDEFKKEAALKAKAEIASWKPEVVITSDDTAAKYLVVPYLNNSNQAVVFCGVNHDASQYGFSSSNVTGMVEVNLFSQLIGQLKNYVKGDRIASLGADTLTRKKSAVLYKSKYNLDIINRYAATFGDWKREFKNLQDEVDMMIIPSPAGIEGWNEKDAVKFVLENTKIPSGTTIQTSMPFAMIGYTKVAQEHGEWSAETALEILAGKKPSDIPVAYNQKAKIYLNMPLAKKLDITFPMELMEQAVFVERN